MRRSIAATMLPTIFAAAALLSCRESRVVVHGGNAAVVHVSDSMLRAGVPDTLRLGRMREGEVVVKEFLLRNEDDKPFVITDFKTNCGCITFDFNRQPVKPGEDKTVALRFDSRGYYGNVVKKTTVLTSFSEKPHTIYVEADVE